MMIQKKKYFVPTKSDKIYSNLIMQKSFFSHSSVLFNKEVVLSIGGYREFLKNLKIMIYGLGFQRLVK